MHGIPDICALFIGSGPNTELDDWERHSYTEVMPELAEVETIRRHLQRSFKGKKIREVITDPHDRYLYAHAKAADVEKALTGAKIIGAGRKGKYLWLELNRKPWPIFHLGMSGNFSVKEKNGYRILWGGAKLWKDRKDDGRLWFSRLQLDFGKNKELSFNDPRRFGRMWLTDDPWTHPQIQKLGFDPLFDLPSAKKLAEHLSRRRTAIKAVLLDQELFAGIGNWLADEILYQSRMAPQRKASELSLKDVQMLRKQLLAVVKKAVAVQADYERFPSSWLFSHRWGKKKGARTSRGVIQHKTIGGRTTAWVPTWQK